MPISNGSRRRYAEALMAAEIVLKRGKVRTKDLMAAIEVIVALDKSESGELIKKFKGLDKAARQQLLDDTTKTLKGDDLSDLMFDLEHAGFHDLKKPQQQAKKSASNPYRRRVA